MNTTTTRQEHLNWCKQRALEYLKQNDIRQCAASFMSDMGKHEETRNSMQLVNSLIMMELMSPNKESMRRCIEGFN